MVARHFVADESVDYRLINALRACEADVFAIRKEHPAMNDEAVLRIAHELSYLLITEDKDFGELVFRTRQPH